MSTTHTHMHTCIGIHAHVCMHMHMHAHIHTHTLCLSHMHTMCITILQSLNSIRSKLPKKIQLLFLPFPHLCDLAENGSRSSKLVWCGKDHRRQRFTALVLTATKKLQSYSFPTDSQQSRWIVTQLSWFFHVKSKEHTHYQPFSIINHRNVFWETVPLKQEEIFNQIHCTFFILHETVFCHTRI